jgi:hypothetical protein
MKWKDCNNQMLNQNLIHKNYKRKIFLINK